MTDTHFHLKKRGLYYRPDACGYTELRQEAGLYTEAECRQHVDSSHGEVSQHRITPYCADCGKDMKHNVPRLGPDGGWVHADTGQLSCGPYVAPILSAAGTGSSDTPRTDAIVINESPTVTRITSTVALADLCRALERELVRAVTEIKRLHALMLDYHGITEQDIVDTLPPKP